MWNSPYHARHSSTGCVGVGVTDDLCQRPRHAETGRRLVTYTTAKRDEAADRVCCRPDVARLVGGNRCDLTQRIHAVVSDLLVRQVLRNCAININSPCYEVVADSEEEVLSRPRRRSPSQDGSLVIYISRSLTTRDGFPRDLSYLSNDQRVMVAITYSMWHFVLRCFATAPLWFNC